MSELSGGKKERDGRVRVLPEAVARKIAAGEVVDRPAALVRELLDNALDSGATAIEVILEGGGATRTEVSDNGRGMTREDLELCHLPHATSKIETEEDLLSIRTLGFRGEALSSIAAVSRLEITSSQSGGAAVRLCVGPAGLPSGEPRIEDCYRAKGTSVRVSGLFDTIPARKRFLKRDGSEALAGKTAFLEKALSFPAVSFRFTVDGALKTFLPSVSGLRERFAAACGFDERLLHEVKAQGEGFTVTVIVGGPELSRGDRRFQFILANGRRIDDFSLQQALEYGCQGAFPNGSHPVGALFLDIDPALADFNIHPAKREARFRDSPAIHRCVSTVLKEYFARTILVNGGRMEEGACEPPALFTPDAAIAPAFKGTRTFYAPDNSGKKETLSLAALAALTEQDTFEKQTALSDTTWDPSCDSTSVLAQERAPENPVRYLGRAFGLFLLAEKGESLYLIDQHAAHERLLYDELASRPPARQDLLVPYPFETESAEEDSFLRAKRAELEGLGIGLEDEGNGRWQLTSLPELWRDADSKTIRDILSLKNAGEALGERWRATMACKKAVKDGDYLDPSGARDLAERALKLPIPRCPHGRPVWMEIERETILRSVRRVE